MKITLEPTTKIVMLDTVPARVWEGETQTGIRVVAFITRLAVASDERTDPATFASTVDQLGKELLEVREPSTDVGELPQAIRL